MSYARFGEGDVYVYDSISGGFECCSCSLQESGYFVSQTRSAMLEHLEKHIEAGHYVPSGAMGRLRSEMATVGNDWAPYDANEEEKP